MIISNNYENETLSFLYFSLLYLFSLVFFSLCGDQCLQCLNWLYFYIFFHSSLTAPFQCFLFASFPTVLPPNNLVNNGCKLSMHEDSNHGQSTSEKGLEDDEDDAGDNDVVDDEAHEKRIVLHSDNINDQTTTLSKQQQQALSPRQPLDCIPVETVLQEHLPDGSYLSAECFNQHDHVHDHCASISPDQTKCK